MLEQHRDYSSWFGDNIDGIKEIKLWNLYINKCKVFDEKQEKIQKNKKEASMLSALNSSSEIFLEWCVTGVLYILGGFLIVNGNLTVGGVFAFLSYSSYVTGSISNILNLKLFMVQIIPSAKRLFKVLDIPDEASEGHSLHKKNGHISFNKVSFSYDRKILDSINLIINPGEKIAIIGSNGSGKTTILNLLLRFIEPDNGEIYINTENINSINLDQYRSLFSVVSQNPYLFFDTLINNIDLKGDATHKDINQVYKQSRVDQFLYKLSLKENTVIGINGTKLSGGEKQKLAVARALLKNTPIIILDEATSGFDQTSSQYLHEIIFKEMNDKTVIMITHQYDHLNKMDHIFELVNGALCEIDKNHH